MSLASRILLLALALLGPRAAAQDTARVELIFLDVGQGDAVVIRGPGGKVALIDAGPRGGRVAERLVELGVDTVHLAVASHPHADHIGGMAAVLERFPVKAYLDSETPHTSQTYLRLMALVDQTRARDTSYYLRPTARAVSLGPVRIRVLPPPSSGRSINNRSVGLLLEFGEFRALFPGDAEQPELAWFATLALPRVTVLKASHHGAWNGVSEEWLEAIQPLVVVISVGARNSYGHPDARALRYYGSRQRPVYRTDLDGEITIRGARDGTYEVTTAHAR